MLNIQRRTFLRSSVAVATASVVEPTWAVLPLVPIIIPTILAGLFGILQMREQNKQQDKQNSEQMQLNYANLQMAIESLRWQQTAAVRAEKVQILTTLLQRDEAFAKVFLAQTPIMESIAFDSSRQPLNVGLSNTFDGRGTVLGITNGQIALERGAGKGIITNQQAQDMGRFFYASGDPMPVPVQRETEIPDRLSWKIAEAIAEKKRFRNAEGFREKNNLVSIRSFSRAQKVGDGADIQCVAFVPKDGDKNGNRRVEFAYFDSKIA